MADDHGLVFKDGSWWTCGCNGVPKKIIELPDNSFPVFIRSTETLNGPVTGIEYRIQPHQVSLDIDRADADSWLLDGTAQQMNKNQKGRLTRTGRIKK